MSIKTISPKELYAIVEAGHGVELLDVRTPVEYREIHVSFARNVPLDQLDAVWLASGQNVSDQTLYVICQSGSRSKQGCERLLAAGYANVVSVEGGTKAWEQAGLPVVRGKKCISLERQVRIAAGTLVVAGAALGALVHPYWMALPAFVGAGLIHAGITDSCAMGMLFARMPWNQVPKNEACATAARSGTCAPNAR